LPAAEVVTDDPHGRRGAADRGEAVFVGLAEYLLPAGAALDAGKVRAGSMWTAFIRTC
jgi:hypothetical protein